MNLDRQQLDHLERHERQITVVAAVVVLVLAGGLAMFMYPLVFVHPEGNKWMLRVAFFGFCALTLLFAGYLFDRQRTVARLTKQLVEELQRNLEIRQQASVDILKSMPDINHFWDRLTMEFRRSMTMQKTLCLLLVKSIAQEGSANSSQSGAPSRACGDAAKAISAKLRPTDSIYLLGPDLFGLVLPETDTTAGQRIATRLQDELKSVRATYGGSFEFNLYNYPEHVNTSHELEDIVKSSLPEQEESMSDAPFVTR